MRNKIRTQLKLGQKTIDDLEFDLKSRDEIPQLLMGLQYIYKDHELLPQVFSILKEIIPSSVDKNKGRPGMELWKILVLGTLRLNCNIDYDKLKELADNHGTLRVMLGHSTQVEWDRYPLQTIKDNVSLLTPEVLDRISELVVKAGHKLLKVENEKLRGKCDSYVAETNVRYPTDITLLFEAIRKVISLVGQLCEIFGITAWRQNDYNIRKIKKLFRKAQNAKHSTSEEPEKIAKKEALILSAHQAYLELVENYLKKAALTLEKIRTEGGILYKSVVEDIENYVKHAERQIDQTRRRVVNGEKIPHDEKVFSIFEEHTEWISKGKAGVSQELGVRVAIVQDQYDFILHHIVMQNQTDDTIAVQIIREAKKMFPNLFQVSFDKGFYSPKNKADLKEILDFLILPKKGKLAASEIAEESSPEFIQGRKKHSGVESAIHALENHGLDICPDHGIQGFKRYVSLGILGRNIQILGTIVQKRELRKQKRREKAMQALAA